MQITPHLFKQPQNNWVPNPRSTSAGVHSILQIRWNNARQWRRNTPLCNCKYCCNSSSRRKCPCPHRKGRGPVFCILRKMPRLQAILFRRRSLACIYICLPQVRKQGVCLCCMYLLHPWLPQHSGSQLRYCTHHRSPCPPQPEPGSRGRRGLWRRLSQVLVTSFCFNVFWQAKLE